MTWGWLARSACRRSNIGLGYKAWLSHHLGQRLNFTEPPPKLSQALLPPTPSRPCLQEGSQPRGPAKGQVTPQGTTMQRGQVPVPGGCQGHPPPPHEAPCPQGLTEDVEGGGVRAAGPCRGLHRAVVGGGVGGSHAGEGEDWGRAAAEPNLVLVPGVAQRFPAAALDRAGQVDGVAFLDVRGGGDPDPGSCGGRGRR